ncbi:RNA polymerase II holoenzyme cyclin-like subunit [Saitoella coloradoensis]
MAANYWASSQRHHWLFTRSELDETHRDDLRLCTPDELRYLKIYFYGLILRLGKRLNLRQQPIATATTYFSRFYTRAQYVETNPYLVLTTCLYLACKTEESPVHIRTVVAEARHIFPEHVPSDTTKLAECEFYLIEELGSDLVTFHPYTTVIRLQEVLKIAQNDLETIWTTINDTYSTDLILLHPPHIIAMTATYITLILPPIPSHNSVSQAVFTMEREVEKGTARDIDSLMDFLAKSNIDMEAVADCTQEIMSLYEVWQGFRERSCKEVVQRMLKAAVV